LIDDPHKASFWKVNAMPAAQKSIERICGAAHGVLGDRRRFSYSGHAVADHAAERGFYGPFKARSAAPLFPRREVRR
jgi:hypothetical protein